MLKEFVLNQDISRLHQKEKGCDCKIKYHLERDYH